MTEPEQIKLTRDEGEALIERVKASDLAADDRRVLERLIRMYFWLLFVVQEAKLSMKRLRGLLFGKGAGAGTDTKAKKPPPTDDAKGLEAAPDEIQGDGWRDEIQSLDPADWPGALPHPRQTRARAG